MKHIIEFDAGFDLIEHPTDAEFRQAADWLGFGNHNVGEVFSMALDHLDRCNALLGTSLDDLAAAICPDTPHYGNIIARRTIVTFGGFLPILCQGEIRIVTASTKPPTTEKATEDVTLDVGTPDQIKNAMHTLGHNIGLKRPLRSAELGRALGLSGKNAGKSVDRWLKGQNTPQGRKLDMINALLRGAEPICGPWRAIVSPAHRSMLK